MIFDLKFKIFPDDHSESFRYNIRAYNEYIVFKELYKDPTYKY